MNFSRNDYNERIVDTAGLIPDDEPVFLLRGKDPLAPRIVLIYAMELRLMGGDPYMASNLEKHAQDMIRYQKEHGTKIPDMYRDSENKQNLKRMIDEIVLKWKESGRYLPDDFKRFQDILQEYTNPNLPSVCILMKSDLKEGVEINSPEDISIEVFNEDAQLQISKYDIAFYVIDASHLFVVKYEL